MKGSNRSRFLFMLVVLLGALSAFAQVDYSTATLRGTITDPQGAVIPGPARRPMHAPAVRVAVSAADEGSENFRARELEPLLTR